MRDLITVFSWLKMIANMTKTLRFAFFTSSVARKSGFQQKFSKLLSFQFLRLSVQCLFVLVLEITVWDFLNFALFLDDECNTTLKYRR